MPYAPHVRITASGKVGQGNSTEAFSYGFNLESYGGVFRDKGDLVQDLADDIAAFHGAPGAFISSEAVLTEVKAAPIGADGKYTADPIIIARNTPGGGGPGVSHPFQVALAVSLMTDRRGPSGKGRFYLPCPKIGVQNDGTIETVNANAVRQTVLTLLNAVNNQPGVDLTGGRIVVASRKGFNSPVTGVRIGRVLDTVRSRRRQLEEQYTAVAGLS